MILGYWLTWKEKEYNKMWLVLLCCEEWLKLETSNKKISDSDSGFSEISDSNFDSGSSKLDCDFIYAHAFPLFNQLTVIYKVVLSSKIIKDDQLLENKLFLASGSVRDIESKSDRINISVPIKMFNKHTESQAFLIMTLNNVSCLCTTPCPWRSFTTSHLFWTPKSEWIRSEYQQQTEKRRSRDQVASSAGQLQHIIPAPLPAHHGPCRGPTISVSFYSRDRPPGQSAPPATASDIC